MIINSYSEYFIIVTKMILFVVSLFFVIHLSYSTFKKSLTINDINVFIQVDELKFLIVEAINESAYGFDLSKKVEKAAAIKVVTDENDFTVVGWSISNIIPNWVKTFDEWNIYICDQRTNVGNSNIVNHQMLGSEVGLEQHFDTGAEVGFDNLTDEIKRTNGKVYHNPYLKV